MVTGANTYTYQPGPEPDSGTFFLTANPAVTAVSFDEIESLQTHGVLFTLPDRLEPNDSIADATVLGSLQKITLNDLTIHERRRASPTMTTSDHRPGHGQVVINAFFVDDLSLTPPQGNLDLEMLDANGNQIASSQTSDPNGAANNELIIIPVVGQQQVYSHSHVVQRGTSRRGQVPNVYDLEIENFAAPVPAHSGTAGEGRQRHPERHRLGHPRRVTLRTNPEIIIEADLDDFYNEGITILTAAQLAAGNVPGAAVQVFVNGNPVGYAEPVAGTGNTKFRYTFLPGQLPVAAFPADSGGWLHNVKAAVTITDGQGRRTSTAARSCPSTLALVVDTAVPALPSQPELADYSNSGSLLDTVTSIQRPAFTGTAEHNGKIRMFANNGSGPVLVGEGVVGSDGTETTQDQTNPEPDQIGYWEVTVEPLADGLYKITATVEDLAGNISLASDPLQHHRRQHRAPASDDRPGGTWVTRVCRSSTTSRLAT